MRRQKVHDGLDRAWADPDPEQDQPYSTLIAWRITRAHLSLTGRLDYNRPIHELILDDLLAPLPSTDIGRWLDYAERVRARGVLEHLAGHPASLFPDPQGNGTLHAWQHTALVLATYLGIQRRAAPPAAYEKARPDMLEALLSEPGEHWPSFEALLVFEDDLARGFMVYDHQHGANATITEWRRRYALRDRETLHLRKLALALATRYAQHDDLEQSRADIVARLEHLLQLAISSQDLRAAYALVAKIAVVRGVTRAAPEDLDRDFARVIAKVSNEDASPLLEGQALALPPPPPEPS